MFTENGYTREHRQNLQNLVDQIDRNKRDAIEDNRNTKGFNPMVWKMIRKHGSFTGRQAANLGLVDHLPKLSPLGALLESNKGKTSKERMMDKLGNETDVSKFNASEQISLTEYASLLEKRKNVQRLKWKIHRRLKTLSESSSILAGTIGLFGYHAPLYNIPEVRAMLLLLCRSPHNSFPNPLFSHRLSTSIRPTQQPATRLQLSTSLETLLPLKLHPSLIHYAKSKRIP
jgi:hypothetical protein